QAREQAQRQLHAAASAQQRLEQQQQHRQQWLDEADAERDALSARLDAWRRRHPTLDDATLARLLAESDDAIQVRARRIREADSALERAATAVDERRRALIDHRRDQGLAAESVDDDHHADEHSDSHPLLG